MMGYTVEHGCCGRVRKCRCLLYPSELRLLGGFLAFFAGVLVLAFGMSYLKPFIENANFRNAVCNTTSVVIPTTEQYTSCRCFDDDKKCRGVGDAGNHYKQRQQGYNKAISDSQVSRDRLHGGVEDQVCYQRCETGTCYSCFPCVRITVDYTSNDNRISRSGAFLYKSKDVILESYPDWKCFHLSCTDDIEENEYNVWQIASKYTTVGSIFPCFYDKTELEYVIVDKVDRITVYNSMFWPCLFCLIGVFMVLTSFVIDRMMSKQHKRAEIKSNLLKAHTALYKDDTPQRYKETRVESEKREGGHSLAVPNIPLSDRARSSPMFAHAQAKAGPAPVPRSPAVDVRPPGHKQRRVSVIKLSTPTPKGGMHNLAFVVTDHADALDPGMRTPMGDRRQSALRKHLDSHRSGDSIGLFSQHRANRAASFESLDSESTDDIDPADFNPPGIVGKTRRVGIGGSGKDETGSGTASTISTTSSHTAYSPGMGAKSPHANVTKQIGEGQYRNLSDRAQTHIQGNVEVIKM